MLAETNIFVKGLITIKAFLAGLTTIPKRQLKKMMCSITNFELTPEGCKKCTSKLKDGETCKLYKSNMWRAIKAYWR